MKSPPPTTKRFHINMIISQVYKFFVSSNHVEPEKQKPKNCMYLLFFNTISYLSLKYLVFILPSISVTSPDGETTLVE